MWRLALARDGRLAEIPGEGADDCAATGRIEIREAVAGEVVEVDARLIWADAPGEALSSSAAFNLDLALRRWKQIPPDVRDRALRDYGLSGSKGEGRGHAAGLPAAAPCWRKMCSTQLSIYLLGLEAAKRLRLVPPFVAEGLAGAATVEQTAPWAGALMLSGVPEQLGWWKEQAENFYDLWLQPPRGAEREEREAAGEGGQPRAAASRASSLSPAATSSAAAAPSVAPPSERRSAPAEGKRKGPSPLPPQSQSWPASLEKPLTPPELGAVESGARTGANAGGAAGSDLEARLSETERELAALRDFLGVRPPVQPSRCDWPPTGASLP